MCGNTHWKAARAHSSSMAKLDETGLSVAGCRHTLAQKAVNMFTGEKYGYMHYIHTKYLLPWGVKYLWQDIICKYWPWAAKETITELDDTFQDAVRQMKPALSVMHAKAHSWDCQVSTPHCTLQTILELWISFIFYSLVCIISDPHAHLWVFR